ncbi:MAG: MBL fold metallo-hydrolase [Candidatus Taylorbacteria bacterium]|nr:MBL fold metallo-hydrolase [Candidatus Taylorbacteria bacterium]
MIVSSYGVEFFKIQHGDIVLAVNPPSKNSAFKKPRFGADIVLSTANHPDLNGVAEAAFGGKTPFEIAGPGEYEVKGVFVKGLASVSRYGGERLNTIYYLTLEGVNICFLGALGMAALESQTKETLDDVDILFVPIGGEGVLEASDAYRLAVSLEPKLIIPMHYGEVGRKDALKIFLKEGGAEDAEAVDKLTVKKKDLDSKEGEIVILQPQN